jgi:hypothetical protein
MSSSVILMFLLSGAKALSLAMRALSESLMESLMDDLLYGRTKQQEPGQWPGAGPVAAGLFRMTEPYRLS